MDNVFESCLKIGARPADRRPVWQWLEDNIEVGNVSFAPGPWRLANSPHTKRIYDLLPDNSIHEIIVSCAAQTHKSQTGMNCVCWAMAQDPGPCMWHTDSDPNAEKFLRDRIGPQFHQCKALSDLIVHEGKRDVSFRTAPFYLSGTGGLGKVASFPVRWHFMDEVAKWGRGRLNRALKRTAAFWNARKIAMSTPELVGDEFDALWKSGTCEFWFFPCVKCGQMNQLVFDRIKWDENSTTKKEDKWNYDEVAKTIRFECANCGHKHFDTPEVRRHICERGQFIATNKEAPRWRVSINWNALLPPLRSWASVVREYLESEIALRFGNKEPKRTFINETLGLPWEDQLGVIEDFGFIEHRFEDYDYGEEWSDEVTRFLSVDRQIKGGEHYWWLIRAFGHIGNSRLIAYGKCNTKLELEKIRTDFRVERHKSILDTGYSAGDCYRFCLDNQWQAFKGEDNPFFLMKDERTGKTVRKLWTVSRVDSAIGTNLQGRGRMIRLTRFSSPGLKDLLFDYLKGNIPGFTIPSKIGRDYKLHITAEERRELESRSGHVSYYWHQLRRDNHLLDCELQILVGAIECKLLYSSSILKDDDEKPAE